MVLPLQWEELGGLDGAELQVLFVSMARQIQELLTQRDTHLEVHTQYTRTQYTLNTHTHRPTHKRDLET